MIWFIIVGAILLGMVILLLSGVWEIEKTKVYYLDKNGRRKVCLKYTQEWKNIPEGEEGPLYDSLKDELGERYVDYQKRLKAKESSPDYYLKNVEVKVRVKIHRKIQVASYWYENARSIAAYIIGGIDAIALLAMIGTSVGCKVEWAVQEQTVKYEERITKLENNKQYILTYYTYGVSKDIDISSTNIPAVIKEHNNEVEELAQKIKVDTINLNNPWVSPWVNPACKNIDLKRIVGDPNDPNDTGLYISKLA